MAGLVARPCSYPFAHRYAARVEDVPEKVQRWKSKQETTIEFPEKSALELLDLMHLHRLIHGEIRA